ncbi:DnaJ family protein [Pelomyxa schiedti]|nr:DnaJ family protein [Pelomyxa schiedti]
MGSLGFFAFQERCEKCRGTGVLIKHTCHQCGGSGTITVGDSVVVSIPPGAASDSIFVFPEKSNEMLGGVIPGDVRVNLRVKPHPDFVRINDTLKTSTTVSLLEALVGFVQEIKHLDGHIVYLNSSISTFPNTLTLKGEGMPCGKPPSPVVKLLCWYMSRPLPTCSGDLLVNINVRYPRSLSLRQTAGLRQLLADEDTNAGTEAAPH